ncbi:MAG: DUF5655 domain-containing protein [Bacteroidota bacterium]
MRKSFEERPIAMNSTEELYTELLSLLKRVGTFKTEHKKESIHIVHGRAFVGIHPKKSYLGVNIVLEKGEIPLKADKVEQVSSHRFHHFFKITSKRQMNKPFVRLLHEAYHLTNPKEK